MKRICLFGLLALFTAVSGCGDFKKDAGEGELRWRFFPEMQALTKAIAEMPDTNDFILEILDEKGEVLYRGAYGKSPESLMVRSGSYTVSVRSIEFSELAFSAPQYGDTQVVVVPSGQSVAAVLTCRMLNAGIKLNVAPDFVSAYPGGVLYVNAGEKRLMYDYSEKRVAYFRPGPVSLLLSDQGAERTLFVRNVSAQEVLSIGIAASDRSASGAGLSIAVDTSKNWIRESLLIGEDDPSRDGSEKDRALSVSEAAAAAGKKNVWVYGYIVGGDLTSSGKTVKTEPPFSKRTHLALAARASVTAKSSCIAVELKAGTVRDALNIADHPSLIGSMLYIKGDLVESYYGTAGLKNTSAFELKEP